jgi:predicted phosphodiesterase
MRYAFFSDIHSNIFALEAVLADVVDAGVDQRYVLGDLVGYAPWPNEVLDRLRDEAIPIVMGNYDDGTGFGRDECGCAYTHPVEKAFGEDQGEHQRCKQGLASHARASDPLRG